MKADIFIYYGLVGLVGLVTCGAIGVIIVIVFLIGVEVANPAEYTILKENTIKAEILEINHYRRNLHLKLRATGTKSETFEVYVYKNHTKMEGAINVKKQQVRECRYTNSLIFKKVCKYPYTRYILE